MKPELVLIPRAEGGGLTAFFRRMLKEKLAAAALLPQRDGASVVLTLAARPEGVTLVDQISPVMSVNAASVLSELLVRPSGKIAALVRPCEARALIKLIKLKQASPDRFVLFSADCYGTFPVKEFSAWAAEVKDPESEFLAMARKSEAEEKLRAGCRLCLRPVPGEVDVALRVFGGEREEGIAAEIRTEKGKELLKSFGLSPAREDPERKKYLEALLKRREAKLQAVDVSDFLSLISNCIRCYNCRAVCPICYCKECLFSDPQKLGYSPEKYLSWAERRGALRMPVDTLLFHLTRLNHMVSSCVACGMCEAACPNDIPLAKIYAAIGAEVGKLLEYEPGRSLEDPIPLSTFREDELKTVED